jgi:hypothetical protein
MRENRRHAGKASQAEIAHVAARMLVEGTAESFAEAKRKAAESLGLMHARKLPENMAVQEALVEYQALFGGETHRARIVSLRHAALEALHALAVFEPRLVGPVLYGTACEYSPVTLHLYTDEVEAVIRHFHDLGMAYGLGETRLNIHGKQTATFPSFEISESDVDFDIVVLPHAFLAHPPLSSLDGKPFRRATATALEKLLASADPAGPQLVSG